VRGCSVDASGCPPLFYGDLDRDADVDMDDFALVQLCLTGPGHFQLTGTCLRADANQDGNVDRNDVWAFKSCTSGPGVLADPSCLQVP
jgi:hypothetical protein